MSSRGLILSGLVVMICTIFSGRNALGEPAGRGQRGELVDRVVAVVSPIDDRGEGVRIVTLFELTVEARLERAERARSIEAARAEPTADELRAVLRRLVDALLVEGEAARLALDTVSADDLTRERLSLSRRLGGEGAIERFRAVSEAPEELIVSTIRRRAIVTRLLQGNVGLSENVTEAAVEAAYAAGDHPFVGQPLEEVRRELRALLAAGQRREQFARWLEEIRSQHRVQLIAR